MSQSQVPRGTTKKQECKKCGQRDWLEECRFCNPKKYGGEKKK